MLQLLKDVYVHLSPKRRVQLVLVLLLMLAGALAEVVTLGAVLPFLSLLADPSLGSVPSWAQRLLQSTAGVLGIPPLLAAALLFGGMALVAGGIRLLLAWASFRYVFLVGADLGREIYSRILQQPYAYHLEHNSSETLAAMQKVDMLVMGTLAQAMQLVIASLMCLFIFGGLLLINTTVALAAGSLFAGLYLLISRYAKRKLTTNGQIITQAYVQKNKAMQEGLGAIRDVILDGNHAIYVRQFSQADLAQRYAQATNMVLAGAPKYVIESIGVVLIVGLAYTLAQGPSGAATALPVLGALALGAQKMLPYMQNIYNALASIRGNQAGAVGAINLLQLATLEQRSSPISSASKALVGASPDVPRIELRAVSFRYSAERPYVLQNLNLRIMCGQRVGLLGTTGGGKSTLIDVIMGLLNPSSGHVLIDGVAMDGSNVKVWQSRLAHVPQAIYLSDTSLAENIALGVPSIEIDPQRLRSAIEQAQLTEVIEQLPQGVWTRVGERGVQLSGGQRQRVGIARALYKKCDVLILDEATSALDDQTEAMIMRAVYALNPNTTIIMIAHRLSTLKSCDILLELMGGQLNVVGGKV